MNDVEVDLQRLADEAAALPYSPPKVALLEEAVRLADLANHRIAGYILRMELMKAGTFSGRHDIGLVTFAWCCAEYDRHPEDWELYDLLWRYKWIITGAVEFPEISLAQINQLLDDMERRYREFGSTMHAVVQKRREVALWTGQIDLANELQARFLEIERDPLSDCLACDLSMQVEHYLETERWAEAADMTDMMLQNGKKCSEEPHCVLARSLLPLYQLGRLDDARKNQVKGYRLVRRGPEFVQQWARHVVFLVLIAEIEPARKLVDRHLADALVCIDQIDRFEFLTAALLFCERLLRDGVATVKLRLPDAMKFPQTRKGHDVAALDGWLRQSAGDLAKRFDTRNGNGFFQGRIDRIPSLLEAALPRVNSVP
jgi:hypothetical protein